MNRSPDPASSIRLAGADTLAAALRDSRRDTLTTFGVLERALPDLTVPRRSTLNPPLWELGHIGWFQEYWIGRNPQRTAGSDADPGAPRSSGVRREADSLYDSSHVSHDIRWTLPLPGVDATRADLQEQLAHTLDLLGNASNDDASLYFFRLALLHEDMHHEAALYMAQSLGIAIDDPRWQAEPLAGQRAPVDIEAGRWLLGERRDGFAFDNELAKHAVDLPATCIDSRVLSWAEYLPFVDAAGYAKPGLWSEAGRAWMASAKVSTPRYLRREGGAWQQQRHGRWIALDMNLPACHLTAYEAEAWCRWAGRRLPTEAEWERAAVERADAISWGQVWEWTASPFAPYPGFEPHPYRDYSAPWFDTRRVLRGASFMTQPRMRHPRYRNFFTPDRNDVPAGFRTCSLSPLQVAGTE